MTDKPLAEIALDCGLTDQPHLTRLFRRVVGMSPGAWRRWHRTSARELADTMPCRLPSSDRAPDRGKFGVGPARRGDKPMRQFGRAPIAGSAS